MGALRLVADATAHTAFVSGSPSSEWRSMDLNSHRATMFRNGAKISEGTGANVLDGPLSVLLWTANHLSRLGDTIEAGEIVTTGTCTGITPVSPGDVAIADFGSLGKVELRIAAASAARLLAQVIQPRCIAAHYQRLLILRHAFQNLVQNPLRLGERGLGVGVVGTP